MRRLRGAENELTACLPHVFAFLPFEELAPVLVFVFLLEVAVPLPDPIAEPPWETRTQFPKPPAVVNETRHDAPSDPPVHFVLDGRVPDICTVPVDCGERTPFFVIVADPPVNDFPVPVVSMDVDVILVDPSVPLIGRDNSVMGMRLTFVGFEMRLTR